MKRGSISYALALLLSLALNAGILLLGIYLYQTQTLRLSQTAGSEHSVMVMTLEVIASELGREELQRPTVEMMESENDSKPLVDPVKASQEIEERQERLAESLNGTFEHMITVTEKREEQRVINEVKDVHQKSSTSKSENHHQEKDHPEKDHQEKEIQSAETKKREITPISSPPSSVKSNHSTIIPETKGAAQSSTSSAQAAARSGDQFATDFSVMIHSQIEGCYPETSKRRGEEGIVILEIVKSSHQLSVNILQSSGFSRLDRCAISAVEKSLKSVKIEDIPASGIRLKPIRFQLQ